MAHRGADDASLLHQRSRDRELEVLGQRHLLRGLLGQRQRWRLSGGGGGQELLPSSFLPAVLDCFRPGAVPAERKRMLIERFAGEVPLSPAEYRVRLAAGSGGAGLAGDLYDNLADARELARAERWLSASTKPFVVRPPWVTPLYA